MKIRMSLLRRLLAIACGLGVAFAVIAIIQYVGHKSHPLPQGLDFKNTDAIKEFMKTSSGKWSLAWVLVSYIFGAGVGGSLAAFIAKTDGIVKGIIVGVILVGLTFLNLQMSWHPRWFWIASLIAPIPMCILGASFVVYWAKEDEAALSEDEGDSTVLEIGIDSDDTEDNKTN